MGTQYSRAHSGEDVLLPEYPNKKDPRDEYSSPQIGTEHQELCQWGVGWKTPWVICGYYVLGLLVAIIHLVVFGTCLDGRYEDDHDIPSQTYVTAASTIMANIVGLCIRISLAAVFTQYFWRLVRLSPLRLETVEFLYKLRSNPDSLFSLTVFQKGWLLVIIATILWVVPIAMSFPPSAMTVRGALSKESGLQDGLPGMNLSETWNDNSDAIYNNSMFPYSSRSDQGLRETDIPTHFNFDRYIRNPLRQLATKIIVNGELKTMPSPCGPNCSYPLSFSGPYVNCNVTSHDETRQRTTDGPRVVDNDFEIFSANWSLVEDRSQTNFGELRQFQITNRHARNATRTEPYKGTPHVTFHYTKESLRCTPRRADYHVTQTFENGQQHSSVDIGAIHDLRPMRHTALPKHNTSDSMDDIRDHNIISMIMAMSRPLIGSYMGSEVSFSCEGNSTCDMAFQSSRTQSTILDLTPVFYRYQMPLSYANTTGKDIFIANEAILNAFLINITLSAISQFDIWPITANVTRTNLRSQYVFSQPLNLILPYFLTMAVTLPLAAVGLFALNRNGVPATDGGFLQILMTTRGNHRLDQLAAGGCLGGDDNISSRLKELEVRFGELVGDEKVDRGKTGEEDENDNYITVGQQNIGRETALAGFGPKDEVVPLEAGKRYGTDSFISKG